MSETQPDDDDAITSVGELLAHALELEHAAEAHYEQLADSMAVHHNTPAEAVFRRLAALSAEHAAAIAERAGDLELPRIPPWGFKWQSPGTPEGDACPDVEVKYDMSTVQAVELALFNECRGHAYYLHVAATAKDAEARRLAADMAQEEAEHVAMLEALLEEAQSAHREAPDDLDPPHMPA